MKKHLSNSAEARLRLSAFGEQNYGEARPSLFIPVPVHGLLGSEGE